MQTTIGKSKELSQSLEEALAAYRHKIFIERLRWPLPVAHGMERDQFDHPETLYVMTREPNGTICGCARLLPTTEPYLLSEVFPHLLAGAPIPRSRDVWELSRFAATTIEPNPSVNAMANTRSLLAASVKIASQYGAKRLITVSPLGIERLLHRMGVHAHRAGPPMLADGKPIFACWIEIDEQTCKSLGIEVAMCEEQRSDSGGIERRFPGPLHDSILHKSSEAQLDMRPNLVRQRLGVCG